jgi:hypothetical protein
VIISGAFDSLLLIGKCIFESELKRCMISTQVLWIHLPLISKTHQNSRNWLGDKNAAMLNWNYASKVYTKIDLLAANCILNIPITLVAFFYND